MRTPKKFNSWNLNEQEIWLIKKYTEIIETEGEVKKLLAKVRGGQRVHIAEDTTRPDELLLKGEL